ncbi:MAG: 2-amino-4-hydroxy-6-hydroxymethyldihydropteridine diphosphokinase [Gammaproteobacteria bacterium]|nr:2-amino-4-hydroxy-6-hydroxymethyldihydropteridine diphosphokinase [Gammaproteobacteria bacterium]
MLTEHVYVAIGSNIGDSATIVAQAMEAIGHIRGCELRGRSSLYRSAAVGDIPQGDYINAVARLDTELQPLDLLLELQAIEHAYYRNREDERRWAPRTLDLDIVLFGNHRINDSHLVIPHPEFVNRRFVLEPMLEINGDLYIPGYGSLKYLVNQAPALEMEKLASSHG